MLSVYTLSFFSMKSFGSNHIEISVIYFLGPKTRGSINT